MVGYSLHVAVGKVDRSQYRATFTPLTSPVSDARVYEELAAKKRYAPPRRLYDEQATAAAVLDTLGELARVLVPGDLLLLTYSGHGSQGCDAEGDEGEDDNDETWVLYDRQLFDDELWTAWSRFRAGVRIVVVSDSCHSGTILRVSPGLVRPAAPSAVPPGYRSRRLPPAARDADLAARAELYRAAKAAVRPPGEVAVEATVLLLAACQDGEEAFERDDHGIFTRAFRDTWNAGYTGGYFEFLGQVGDAVHQAVRGQVQQTPNYLPLGREDLAFERQRPLSIS